MKKILIIICCIFALQPAYSQLFSKNKVRNDASGGNGQIDNNTLTWGYFLGFNSYDFKFTYNTNADAIQLKPSTGFNVGLVGDVKLNDYMNLRLEPGIFFSTRNLEYPASYGLTDPVDQLREIKSSYVHIPLLLKIGTKRINNFKPFIVGGFSTSLNLSSNENNPDDNSNNQFRMKKTTYYYELGFGVDFYLYYFKFTPSIRGVFALNDELVRDVDPNSPWTGNIQKMQSRGIFINFTFQ
ncbi:PorT family protein [Kordia sp. YSTF-M3]|uniref:PorT family protein n=1 Tax=Kordia aestuariivivens TaxID=2759037 RepID=A0ABR7Q4G7_9FLAO|nr:porin family protein [Kordia aestuariivivens]MBC8753440.1 PorT family protein [Kordia aestuariivivens]